MLKHIFFTLCILTLLSCKTYNEDQKTGFDNAIQSHIDSLQLKGFKKLSTGLVYKILESGDVNQKIKYFDNVNIYYTGSLLNGEIFDYRKENDPINFDVKDLIVGWQDALSLIGEGGKIEIYIPPYLGYGDNKTDKIPQNSILHFVLGVTKVV